MWLLAPLNQLALLLGLPPYQAFLVVALFVTGSYVHWRFQHHAHTEDEEHDE